MPRTARTEEEIIKGELTRRIRGGFYARATHMASQELRSTHREEYLASLHTILKDMEPTIQEALWTIPAIMERMDPNERERFHYHYLKREHKAYQRRQMKRRRNEKVHNRVRKEENLNGRVFQMRKVAPTSVPMLG